MDSESLKEIVSTVRDYVRTVVMPAELEIERDDAIPDRIRKEAAAMGLFGISLPEEYGGLGLDVAEDVEVAMELGYVAPGFRSMFGTNTGIAGHLVAGFGTQEQKDRFLPSIASGEITASFALTETEAGSDPAGLKTKAVRDGDQYVLNGNKRYITNAPLADLFVVFARTGEGTGSRGISAFLVDAKSPGLTVAEPDRKMGQRGSKTAEVYFDSVRVDADRLVGETEGEAFRWALTILVRGRLYIAALSVGLAQRIQDESVAYAQTRKQGGKMIGEHQLIAAQLADSFTEIAAGRALVRAASKDYVDGVDTNAGPSAAKLFCTEMLGRVADRGVQVHGGSGYMSDMAVERLYRDARLYRIYEGTSEIQRLIIGRQLMKTGRE